MKPTLFALFMVATLAPLPALADPSALVAFAKAQRGTLSPQLVSYGVVAADPDFQTSVPAPRDARILALSVRVGQVVHKGSPLVTIESAPAASVAYAQAASTLSFAETDLAHTRRLYDEQLATKSQLSAAEKAYSDARVAMAQQTRIGANHPTDTLISPAGGVVVALNGARGDLVGAGTLVASIANADHLTVNLGLEPQAAAHVRVGAQVHFRSHQDVSLTFDAPIIATSAMIDSQTRLVNAVARVPEVVAANLLVGMTLVGRIDLDPSAGIVVPRAALLSDAAGTYVFIVDNKNIARRRGVGVSLETDRAALIGRGLAPGERVVVDGLAGLDDGMAVRTR